MLLTDATPLLDRLPG